MKLEKTTSYLLIKWLIIAVVFFSLHSCKTKDQQCFQSTVTLNYSKFFWRDSIKVYQAIDSTHGDSIYKPNFLDSGMNSPEFLALPFGSDSVYGVVGAKLVSTLYGPLDPDKDSIRYRFRTDTTSSLFDTITFYYTPQVHFINNACGYTYYYNLTNVTTTKNMLDSAAIITPLVTGSATGTVNVNFYFKKN